MKLYGTYCIEIQKKTDCSLNCENYDCYLVRAIDRILEEIEEKNRIINKIKKNIEILNECIKIDMQNFDEADELWKESIHRSMRKKIEIREILQKLLEEEIIYE